LLASAAYAQLVADHVEQRGAAQSAIETQDAALAARIDVHVHAVADLDARVSQIDAAIAEATRRDRTSAAISAREAQKKRREGIVDEAQTGGRYICRLTGRTRQFDRQRPPDRD